MNGTPIMTPPTGATAPSGTHWTERSLVMLPMMLVSAVLVGLLEFALLAAKGLEGSEPLAEQGAYGIAVFLIGNLLLLPIPAYLGVDFGIRARRLEGGRGATVGLIANAAVIAVIWIAVIRTLLVG